uniref:ZP domain-containing protein n=1 Tax=Elaeophora elaphi TaxID=1147741 RepID=A0A0R3S6T1_9BILA
MKRHVYVKGLYDQDECRSDAGGRQVAGIELSFDSCNVVRTRSLNPRGVFVTTTVVISFHPLFITKIDRAYRVQCFYMEADKTVSAEIEVSDMTTVFQTQVVPMPLCRYELLDGGPTGQPIQYAVVGQPIYHKWTCDSEAVDTFCALVHSCFVDDGNGDMVQILNEEGCALDKYLLNNLEYPTDLMAGQEAHVYKYADRSQLFYQCEITVTIKEPNADCERPKCPEPEGFGAIQQSGRPSRATETEHAKSISRMRLLKKRAADFDTTMDVRIDINTIDIIDENVTLPEQLRYREQLQNEYIMIDDGNTVCMSPVTLYLVAALTALIIAPFIVYVSYLRKQKLLTYKIVILLTMLIIVLISCDCAIYTLFLEHIANIFRRRCRRCSRLHMSHHPFQSMHLSL